MATWSGTEVAAYTGTPARTATSLRIVPLPQFVVTMLQAREQHGLEVPVFRAAGSWRPGLNWNPTKS